MQLQQEHSQPSQENGGYSDEKGHVVLRELECRACSEVPAQDQLGYRRRPLNSGASMPPPRSRHACTCRDVLERASRAAAPLAFIFLLCSLEEFCARHLLTVLP